MATNRTFTMLKPDAIENNHAGNIIQMIIDAGFKIKAMKYTQLSEDQAKTALEKNGFDMERTVNYLLNM